MPLSVADASEMVKVLSDPVLYKFTGGQPPTSQQLALRYERQQVGLSSDGLQRWHNWIVRQRLDDAAVGYVQATLANYATEVAWVIGARWQGNGYAKEAAQGMCTWLRSHGAQRVVAHIHPSHAASVAVAKSLGLRPTSRIVDGEVEWIADAEVTTVENGR